MGVKVSRNSKGKGSLTFNFKNDEEFERLIDFINKGN
jgi:stalled ribosome alternative rescue factor ArfA